MQQRRMSAFICHVFFFFIWTEYRTPYGSKLSALVNICNGDSEGLKSIMHLSHEETLIFHPLLKI